MTSTTGIRTLTAGTAASRTPIGTPTRASSIRIRITRMSITATGTTSPRSRDFAPALRLAPQAYRARLAWSRKPPNAEN
jgi:hypothetical protein